MRYVVHRRFRDICLGGKVNLPYGAICETEGEIIVKDGKPLVFTTSENAHQFFARDDDGKGLERGRLTQKIQSLLRLPDNMPRDPRDRPRPFTPKERAKIDFIDAAWARIWKDPKIQPYKMREHADFWLWNHAFFNADIETLGYIIKVIKGGTICTE